MRGNGYLVFDGCWVEGAMRWSYSKLPGHQPLPVLAGTPYNALAELGPILIQSVVGDEADQLWKQEDSPIHHGVWLESKLIPSAMQLFLQSRIQVSSQSGQHFWLRLMDSRPLREAFDSQSQWPEGFWEGIDAIWLQENQNVSEAWRSQAKASTQESTEITHACTNFILNNETLQSLARVRTESLT